MEKLSKILFKSQQNRIPSILWSHTSYPSRLCKKIEAYDRPGFEAFLSHGLVDGRQPGWSVGASFEESARIMRALGATDAVNLDGGGSTTITINQQLINRPSDSTGERPIADAIEIQTGIHTPPAP